ncbi:MAG: cupin domain-containing protein [bacterium]
MEVIRKAEKPVDELMPGIFKTTKVLTDALEILELEISPGKGLKPHDMPSKVCFFVIEGTGTFSYGDRVETVQKNEMIHVNPGQLRFWHNHSENPLKLLVIKSLTEK